MKSPCKKAPFSAGLLLTLLAGGTATAQSVDLQALVDAAADGDTLRLAASRHTSAVIDKELVLIGQGVETVIDGGGRGHALAIAAPGIELRDLQVQNSGTDVTDKESCVWVGRQAAGVRIAEVRVSGCGFGIWVDKAPDPVIVDCEIVGRTDEKIVSDLGNGIHLFNITGGLVADNEVVDGRDGIYISNSTGVLIEGNRIRRTRFAIHYMYSHANRVVGNRTDSSSVGIALMYSKHLQVRDNSAHANRTHGILLRNLYYSRVDANRTTGNADGFFFSGCNYDTLTANFVAGNKLGLLISDSKDNAVSGNSFVGNEEQLSYQNYASIEWAGNYWSDYLGWDRDGDGVGDKAHYPADIASYLVYRYPAVRLVMHSPAMKLLQGLEAQFPVLRAPGVIELRPLMGDPLAQTEGSGR